MHIINRNTVVPFATKDTSLIREIINPRNSPAARQSLAEATLAPGAMTQAHFHPRAEEIYYVLRGTARMRLEDERGIWDGALAAGDALVIPPGRRHQIRNVGADDLIFLCCCSPAYEHEDTVLCEALFGGDEPEMNT